MDADYLKLAIYRHLTNFSSGVAVAVTVFSYILFRAKS